MSLLQCWQSKETQLPLAPRFPTALISSLFSSNSVSGVLSLAYRETHTHLAQWKRYLLSMKRDIHVWPHPMFHSHSLLASAIMKAAWLLCLKTFEVRKEKKRQVTRRKPKRKGWIMCVCVYNKSPTTAQIREWNVSKSLNKWIKAFISMAYDGATVISFNEV